MQTCALRQLYKHFHKQVYKYVLILLFHTWKDCTFEIISENHGWVCDIINTTLEWGWQNDPGLICVPMSVCFHVYPSWCTLLRSLVGWRQSLCTHPDISVAHRERAWLVVNVDFWLQCAPRPTLVHEHAFFTSSVHGMPGTFSYILQRRQGVLCEYSN